MKEKKLIAGLALLLFAFDAGADPAQLAGKQNGMTLDFIEAWVKSKQHLSGPLGIQQLHRYEDGQFDIRYIGNTGIQLHVLSKDNGIQVVDSQRKDALAPVIFNGMLKAKSSLQDQLLEQGTVDAAYDGIAKTYKITRKSVGN